MVRILLISRARRRLPLLRRRCRRGKQILSLGTATVEAAGSLWRRVWPDLFRRMPRDRFRT
jgi:hypothetical protein